MSNVSTIETVEVTLTAAQQKAVRKMALGTSGKSASELAESLLAQVIRGRFKAKTLSAAQDAGEQYDRAVASGLMTADTLKLLPSRQQYVAERVAEYRDLLSEL